MKVYVFPGQGSQSKGMGAELFDAFPEVTKTADNILGYSIKDLCLNDPDDLLKNTKYTQPALFTVNALTFYNKQKSSEEKPLIVAGHSLGEYNALLAAGAVDFETGLKLVKKRGELMGNISGGGMAAIIGMDETKVKEVLSGNNLDTIDIANFNSPSQIVISGLEEDILKAKDIFKDAGVRLFVPLKVSGAFHSRYMKSAASEFRSYLDNFDFSNPKIPVISNVTARPFKSFEIRKNLYEQMFNSVKWCESIRYMMGKGDLELEEIGPGDVLQGLYKRIKREADALVVDDDVDFEQSSRNANHNINENENQASHSNVLGLISSESLGSNEYKLDYNLKYAYASGAMYKGIASKEMVVAMGKAGMMGFLGTGGLSHEDIISSIEFIQRELSQGEAYGVNLLSNPLYPSKEEAHVDLFLKYNVSLVEAAAFMQMTPAIVKYRLNGLKKDSEGNVIIKNKIQAKVSRPEVAELFLSPAPEKIVNKLLQSGKVTNEEAELSKYIPMADDLCIEADSGGHTDMGVAYTLMPAMQKLRNNLLKKFNYKKRVRIGAAGGIGTPEAAAAAFILGADFIVTGSINQCTVEAGISDLVKNLLQNINVQDTEYAPAGDMFEMGAKVQVLKKGVFFPARANKLYDLYRHYNSIDEIDEKTKKQIQEKYFKKSFEEVYAETKQFLKDIPGEIDKAEKNPKYKMALIFRWYFGYATRIALEGKEDCRVDFQVHCGPALGAFNQWVKGTEIEDWRKRNVADIGKRLMIATAKTLTNNINNIVNK